MTMKLRTRITLVLGGFSLAMVLAALWLTRAVLIQIAMDADEERARALIERGYHILDDDRRALESLVRDWASWDDSYHFMENRNQVFIESNLIPGTLEDLRLQVLLYVDTDARQAAVATPARGEGPPDIPAWLLAEVQRPGGMLEGLRRRSSVTGILIRGDELWMVAAAPILTSRDTGPSRGTVFMGRCIDANEIARLHKIVHPSLSLRPVQDGASVSPLQIRPVSAQRLTAQRVVSDVYADGRLMLTLDVPRDAYQQSLLNLQYLTGWLTLWGIAVTVLSFCILDRWVLSGVTESVSALRSGLSTASRDGGWIPLATNRSDEIGELIEMVNATLVAFDASRVNLRASEMRYRVLVETMPEAIAGVDQGQYILFANRAMARLAGALSAQDLIGKALGEVLSLPLARRVARYQQSLAGGRSVDLEPIAIQGSSGREQWVAGSLALVGETPTLPEYTLLCLRDVTSKRQAEREAETRRAEAIEAQKLAALGTLVAGVAHEVNNPNGIVNLNMNVLKRIVARRFEGHRPVSIGGREQETGHRLSAHAVAEMKQIVEETLKASERIAALVASLKRFAQPSIDGPEEVVVVRELIDRSAIWMRHQLKKKQCRFQKAEVDSRLRVRGHAEQLQQVLINLLQNACDAAKPQGSRICVAAEHDVSGGNVVIRVQDDGAGIPSNEIDYVMDPFYTTRRGGGGTGLGLSISAAIVKAHGGRLTLRSSVGEGTTVSLKLPVYEEDSNAG